ncbi:hypothetical protein GCM10023096_18880 [Nonomuraea ferruginea]
MTIQVIIGGVVTTCHHIRFFLVGSDEIWERFGIASWRAHLARLRLVVAAGLSLTVFAAAFWWSGAITPRITWEPEPFFARAHVDERGILSIRLEIAVENEGITPFVLTGLSMNIPGLRLLPAEETEEIEVDAGGREWLTRQIAITDCAAVPHEPRPVSFTYSTWMGSGSAEAMWGPWWMSNTAGGVPVAWQRALAIDACSKAVSGEWF